MSEDDVAEDRDCRAVAPDVLPRPGEPAADVVFGVLVVEVLVVEGLVVEVLVVEVWAVDGLVVDVLVLVEEESAPTERGLDALRPPDERLVSAEVRDPEAAREPVSPRDDDEAARLVGVAVVPALLVEP